MSLRAAAILVAVLSMGWGCKSGPSPFHEVIASDAAVPVASEDAALADQDAGPRTTDGSNPDSGAGEASAERDVGPADVRVADAHRDLGAVDLAMGRDAADAPGADATITADAAPDSLAAADAPADSSTPDAGPPPGCTPAANDPSRAAVATLGTPLPCSGAAVYQYVQFTTPASPGGGGYVVVKFTDVSPGTTIDTFLYMGNDTAFAHTLFELRAVTYWFAAFPATTYVIRVNDNYGGGLGHYTFTATYTPVYSVLRANLAGGADARPQLTVGTPVEDYVFRGYRSRFTDTWSWSYKVTLSAGPATVTLSNLSPDFYTEARMNDASGSDWYSPFTPMGQDFTLTTGGPVAAGEYTIWIEAYMNPKAYGLGETPSSFVTKPFTMVVKQ